MKTANQACQVCPWKERKPISSSAPRQNREPEKISAFMKGRYKVALRVLSGKHFRSFGCEPSSIITYRSIL